ncbi:MAG: hypothetical protein Q4C91_08825 [Eubacteriales bacterium]|nr:hypothetical protein [Eubacteriales bacterium]
MSLVKKIVAGVVVTALIAGAAAGGLTYMKKANQTEVSVISVGSIAETYYSQDTYLEGYITTNVSQNITVDKDMVIEEVYVQKGDTVSEGDKLISFDMTLVEMELNIAKLKKQKQEQDLNKAQKRLYSLQNGGPVDESTDANPGNADNLSGSNMDDDLASLDTSVRGNYLAAAVVPPILAVSFNEGGLFDDGSSLNDGSSSGNGNSSDDGNQEPGSGQDDSSQSSGGDAFQSGGDIFDSGEDDAPRPSPTPTPALDDDTDYFDPYTTEGVPGISDGEATFYEKLDENSEPFTGSGTEEDPFVFLCSQATGKVTVTGSFFNKMAGYSADGTRIEHEGGYWFQLEFHQNDKVADFENRKESCIGYYLIDGSMLEKPADMHVEMEFTVEGASQYEDELPPDDGYNGGDGGSSSSTLTRAEAIKIQQNRIASLKLDIQESDIDIAKLEKKVKRQMVYSRLDGIVANVGDPLTGTSDGSSFISIKSKEGFFVKGAVSELMLDQMQEGTLLNCMSYDSGSFEAEVVDVSDYPVSSNSYFSDSNPNVSYYTYSAVIKDKSVEVSDQEWLTVTLKNNEAPDGSLVLSKAFVRTEDGVSYVYKDDNGTLKKQIVTSGGAVNSGYSVLIKGGITRDDKIAFPYAKEAVDGAKTKESTLEEFYGY